MVLFKPRTQLHRIRATGHLAASASSKLRKNAQTVDAIARNPRYKPSGCKCVQQKAEIRQNRGRSCTESALQAVWLQVRPANRGNTPKPWTQLHRIRATSHLVASASSKTRKYAKTVDAIAQNPRYELYKKMTNVDKKALGYLRTAALHATSTDKQELDSADIWFLLFQLFLQGLQFCCCVCNDIINV